MYRCTICNWTGELPEDAVEVSHGMHRFSDGVVHALRKPISEKWKHSMHVRWHVGRISVSDCSYCNQKESDPVETFLQAEDPTCQAEQEQPQPEPVMGIGTGELRAAVEELESKSDQPESTPAESETAMSFAFRKYKKENTNGR